MTDHPRPERQSETYEVECPNCGHLAEIAVSGPHRCPYCEELLENEWGAEKK
jgi:hypothetical protein